MMTTTTMTTTKMVLAVMKKRRSRRRRRYVIHARIVSHGYPPSQKKAKSPSPEKKKKKKKRKADEDEPKKPAKKAKKKKDPNAPKGKSSAFIFFGSATRAEIKAAHPDWSLGDVGRELGKRWKELTEDDKKRHHDLAAKDAGRAQDGDGGGTRPSRLLTRSRLH